jgi:hypothetical protein
VKIFDPDNPLVGAADPNDPNNAINKPDDNVKDGGLDGSGNPPLALGITPSSFTLTLGNNQTSEFEELTITHPQPGNNFIAAAMQGKVAATLASLKFRDDGVTLHHLVKGNLADDHHTDLLTVWRRLWVESDHMDAPGDNDGPFNGDPDCNNCDDVRATPGAPTIDTLSDLLESIPVIVLPVSGEHDTQDIATFKHHQINSQIPAGVRNVTSSQYYWSVHMLGAYESDPDSDNDPDTEGWLAGWSEPVGVDDPTNFVFYETARDLWAEPEIGGGLMVPLATGLDRISAHEALHRFFGWHQTDPAADEGIMDPMTLMTAPMISLTNRQIKIILSKNWPR